MLDVSQLGIEVAPDLLARSSASTRRKYAACDASAARVAPAILSALATVAI
jgi:hypothetical protein